MTLAQPLVALTGNPNAGKSALFNALTGARQKIANYPGVTVERKAGRMALPDGRPVELIDLPGAYSLEADSVDEGVARDVVLGRQAGMGRPDALILVLDATNLDNHLRYALELIRLGLPIVVALNMVDLAERDGLTIDPEALSRELGVPVIPTVAVRRRGLDQLGQALAGLLGGAPRSGGALDTPSRPDQRALSREARRIAAAAVVDERRTRQWTRAIDQVLLHPVAGLLIFLLLLFVMFQAVFSWSQAPMDAIEAGMAWLAGVVGDALPPGLLRSLLVDGIIAGVGSVLVFLPQILVLFFFILILEASGYMTRAAFVSDRLMALVGLSGHSFIPLLSSFACAIPGIMATRTIMDQRDRLTTIMIAPLMTCSARLPVYTVIIAAFIPARRLTLGIGLQGLILFGLYIAGIVGAMAASFVLRRTVAKGRSAGFLIEMPRYQWPRLSDLALGLWQRARVFLRRAGGIILTVTVILWALVSFPRVPEGSAQSQVEQSIAGRIAGVVEPVFRPIGFNRQIVLALIPAMAAREVAVSALGTVYAVDAGEGEGSPGGKPGHGPTLGQRLAADWPLPTALAFLIWFVFAPQCISTIAVTRRETGGWKWPALMVGYLFGLAYIFAGLTYWAAVALGL